MEPLLDALHSYRDIYEIDEGIQNNIAIAISRIEEEIIELTQDIENPFDDEEGDYGSSVASTGEMERSIFDDVDE